MLVEQKLNCPKVYINHTLHKRKAILKEEKLNLLKGVLNVIILSVIISLIIIFIIGLIAVDKYFQMHPDTLILILIIVGAIGLPLNFLLQKFGIIDENIATKIYGTCVVIIVLLLIAACIFGWGPNIDTSGFTPSDLSYP
jgi:hypothetical protein